MSVDEVAKAAEDLWNELAQETVGELVDGAGSATVDEIATELEGLFAQTDAQRRRRGRGGRGRTKHRGGKPHKPHKNSWGHAAKGVAKDAATSIGTSMAEDAAWCAIGDPLNVVGCNSGGSSSSGSSSSGSSSWFAQVEDE